MVSGQARVVLAVDPGRAKCGMAVCSAAGILARAVVPAGDVGPTAAEWQRRFGVTDIVVGDKTGSDAVVRAIAAAVSVPIRSVNEAGTTLAARARYFAEHPPRGWRRLIPWTLQTPPEPHDDYVAVLLAERALMLPAGGPPVP